ncbi:DNA single-strand annealing protein RecT [Hydrogenobacter thermophilus TK-6]|uniref:Phage recombination protein n=1 Tax=Hydrogenobacter thermophilus (strain DSM 6534 / IAM 12695 / TK-6) TaxID=608538 RepID=D3DGM9_HYDTT|nr:RecT family recombinase [Hydrogenobacter thermophilus]ADO44915.1 DNA single-strand annealing protein RecT [Hydrogenobacter thermophilus TK-6]BAI68981.1 phage recombination protein [Hydrogenobacter thermophilus TK-6]
MLSKANTNTIVREEDYKKVLQMLRVALPSLAKVDDETLITAVAYARHLGLDPLRKEVHFVPYYNKELNKTIIQPIVSYTEYLKRAERSGKLKGWSCKFRKEGDELVAVVEIKRVDWEIPFVWEVPLSEVKRDTPLWQSHPLFMLKKTAIAQAFRMCFPEETSHLPYEEAEFWEEPSIPEQTQPTKTDVDTDTESDYITEAQRKRFFAIVKKELGYREDAIKEILKERFGIESTAEIPKDKYEEIIDYFRSLSKPIEAEAQS